MSECCERVLADKFHEAGNDKEGGKKCGKESNSKNRKVGARHVLPMFDEGVSRCGNHGWDRKKKGKFNCNHARRAEKQCANNRCGTSRRSGNHRKTLKESDE